MSRILIDTSAYAAFFRNHAEVKVVVGIAASAAQHGLTVVTLDGDFERIPQVLVRKFEPPTPLAPG